MPDSGKFKDLYLNSALTYPCQGMGRGWKEDSGGRFELVRPLPDARAC